MSYADPLAMERPRPSAAIHVVTARTFEEVRAHRPAWDSLAWNAPQGISNLLPAWVDAYFRHRLAPEESWFCSFAYQGDRLVGALPLVVTPDSVVGKSCPVLRTPYDALTPSGDVVLAHDQAANALNALLAEARLQAPGHLGIDLKAVRKNSTLWDALQAGVDGYVVRRGICPRYSFLNVAGNADDHFKDLKKLRSNVKRFRRKLEACGPVSVELLRGAAAKEAFLPEFIALEASGWKGRNGTAMANNPRVVEFYETLVRNFVAEERWEWHILRVGGRIVAAQMGVRCGPVLTLPKYSFDEEFADGRPGTVLTWEVLTDAFARPEIEEINPMSDGEAHRTWHMQTELYTNIHLVRQSATAIVFRLPRVEAWSFYQTVVRPRIPPGLKAAYKKFRRRGDRKPRRAADSPMPASGTG